MRQGDEARNAGKGQNWQDFVIQNKDMDCICAVMGRGVCKQDNYMTGDSLQQDYYGGSVEQRHQKEGSMCSPGKR